MSTLKYLEFLNCFICIMILHLCTEDSEKSGIQMIFILITMLPIGKTPSYTMEKVHGLNPNRFG